MSSGAFGFLQSDPIFADADVGRYNTLDQVTWRTTLDRVPYTPADKTGRNATNVSIYPDSNPMSYFQQWNLNVQHEIKTDHGRSRLRWQQGDPLSVRLL